MSPFHNHGYFTAFIKSKDCSARHQLRFVFHKTWHYFHSCTPLKDISHPGKFYCMLFITAKCYSGYQQIFVLHKICTAYRKGLFRLYFFLPSFIKITVIFLSFLFASLLLLKREIPVIIIYLEKVF